MPIPSEIALNRVARFHLEPQTGCGFEVRRGQLLKIIDPRGEQVSDLTSFSGADRTEWLSSGRTIDYANTIYLTTGHVLYSNRSRPMWTIVEDTVGRHDFLLTPCSPETFSIIYKTTAHHPSCFENLTTSLAPFGVVPNSIPTTLNRSSTDRLLPETCANSAISTPPANKVEAATAMRASRRDCALEVRLIVAP